MGASSSRNPLLLRNIFNQDVYNEFIKQKKQMRNKFKVEYQRRQEEVLHYFTSKSDQIADSNRRMVRKMEEINKLQHSHIKRNHILKLFADEMEHASKIDMSFFKTIEMGLDYEHQAQVNAALEQFMARAKNAKKSEQVAVKSIFKRKEALETKLFKMKYAKLLRIITDQSRHQSLNQERHPTSIYEENPVDPKIDIPANKYMFETTIKDTFNIDDSSSDEEDERRKFYTNKEMLQQCL